mmetsp:Transcript_21027/g.35872  ORF Transcript_21027/g.35872 Transcript_21027/m.35872 type:complete len:85 (-) Transcript_21027:486-740(-)
MLQVLAVQPGNARALARRGLSFRALRRYEEAAQDLVEARKFDPSLALPLRGGLDKGRPEEYLLALCSEPGAEALTWDVQAFHLA